MIVQGVWARALSLDYFGHDGYRWRSPGNPRPGGNPAADRLRLRRIAPLVRCREDRGVASLEEVARFTSRAVGARGPRRHQSRPWAHRMRRRSPGRATRQILSGAQLEPSRESIAGHASVDKPESLAYWYLVALAVLVVVAAVVWAVWGLGAASPVLLILAIGLVAAWLVL